MKSFVQQLNERVVILGFDVENKIPKIDDIKKNIIEAEVLDVFPKVAQKKGSKGYDYEDLKPWCYPEGFIAYDEDCQKINEVKKRKKTDDLYYEEPEVKDLITLNQLHNFVITDENGIKRYGSCLVIYEKAIGIDENSQEKTIFLPKALCLISLKNILDSNRQFLIYLYRNIFAPSLTNSSANIKLSADLISHFTSILVKNKKNFQVADKEWHGCYQQIKSQIYKNKQINYAIIRQKCLLEFFISLLFTDTSQYLNNECEYLQIVGPNLKERENEIFRMYAKNQTYFCDNFSFKPLFQRLSIGNILLFLQAIIQEKQIILFCSDVNDIVTVCESMMSLIYPLVWKCIYIPFLPYQMWETLECMMPFIIGMHKKYKKFICKNIDIKDKFVIDLDEDTIKTNEYVKIPQVLHDYFYKNISEQIQQFKSNNQTKKWQEIVLNIKKISINFFVGLLNNFIPYFTYSNYHDENNMVAKEIFALDEYNKMFPLEDRNFMQEIADNTMMFSQFLEDSYKILSQVEFQGKNFNSGMDPNGIYPFLKLIKEFQKAQIKQIGKRESYINIQNQVQIVEKAQDQVISKTVQKYKEPFKIDINQHLIKYLIYLQEINEYPFENKAQKEIMDIQNPICQKNMLQQIIHKLNRKRFIQPGQNIQQQQQNLPNQNLNNGLDMGKQLNVQKAQRPPCNNADIQEVKMTLNTNNSAQKNSEQRDLITSYKYEIKTGKQKKNQVSQLDESSRNYDFLDDLLGNEDKFLQQNQNQNQCQSQKQSQKQKQYKNQEINNFSADKQVWETKITEENAEFCEDSGQKYQYQQQQNRQFMAETKQFSPNQENDQEVQVMNFQNSFSINDNFQDKGEDFQVPKVQERNQAKNQNFRNKNQVQGNQANQDQNQNQNQIFNNNQKNQKNQNQNLVSRQSIGQNNRGSSNSSFNQSLQNDQQAFLEMQMQLDEGVEFQEIDLRNFEKRIQLEYDSYENRKIIHEFEKMKMKYQILPEIKLTVIGGRMKEQNGRNRARNQKKHDFFESEMEQQSNLDIIKIADQDYLPKSPMFDQISRENSKQDFNNLSTNRSMKNINNITGDSFQNNQMISNYNNNNGIIKQQNEALQSRPRSNSKGIFSQQSQNNQGIKNQNINMNGKPPLGNSVQNNSNNLGQLGNQRSRQNQNQIQNIQNQNFMMESFGLQNNNNIFNVNNQSNGESSFSNNYNNQTPTMSLKKQNSQKFNISTNGVAQALDFISSQQRSCQKNTGQKDSSQKKGGRKIFQASLEQSNRFYDQNVKQLMSGQLSQVDSSINYQYNNKRDII